MSFTLSNGVIIHEGTDDSLSGLQSIEGVEYKEYNTDTESLKENNKITIYKTDLKLEIKGELSFDPVLEQLYTGAGPHAITVSNTGIFRIEQTVSHYTVLGLVCTNQNGEAYQQGRANIKVARGGKLELINSEIHVTSTIWLENTSASNTNESAIYVRNGKIKGIRIGAQLYVRSWASSKVDVDKIVLENMSWGNFRTPAKFDNATLINSRMVVEGTLNSGTDIPLVLNGFQSIDGSTLQVNGGGIIHSKNTVGGVDPAIVKVNFQKKKINGVDVFYQHGGIVFFGDLSLTVNDTSGQGIEGVNIFSADYDSGARTTITRYSGGPDDYDDYTDDQHVQLTTNSDGTATKNDIVLAVFYRNSNNESKVDYRTPGQDSIKPFQLSSYPHDIVNGSLDFSDGAIDLQLAMLDDLNIADKNKANVEALAEIENNNHFYDSAKLHLVNTFLNPSERSPELIVDFGTDQNIKVANGADVDIDQNASQTFNFNVSNNKITIKSSQYVGSITTEGGTITRLNNEPFAGSFTDKNGTVTTTLLILTGLKPDTEVRVYEAGTATELAGVENSGTTFAAFIPTNKVDISIHSLNYKHQRLYDVDTAVNLTLPIQQQQDRGYLTS